MRAAAALTAVTASSLMLAGPALAAGGGQARVDGSVLRYDAVPGDVNTIVVTKRGTSYYVDDLVRIAPGAGCRYITPNDHTIVACATAGIHSISVTANDRDDTVDNAAGTPATLSGGTGKDTLDGGSAADILYGNQGNDTLNGRYGADRLDGGPGNDTVYGWNGNDTLYGRAGKDELRGGPGNDTAYGGAGKDTLLGQDGNDKLNGNEGDDVLNGGSGTNRLDGGSGKDRCSYGPTMVNCNP